MGYQLDEIVGASHSIFLGVRYAQSEEYALFWQKLCDGTVQTHEFSRRHKAGRKVWLNAIYTPLFGADGSVEKIVKFATEIDEPKRGSVADQAKSFEPKREYTVIEFSPEGNILTANKSFLDSMGYAALRDIQGQHHSIFVDKEYSESDEYKAFWQTLKKGLSQTSEHIRFDKSGEPLWVHASYNPVIGNDGKVTKIVKVAVHQRG